MRGRRTVFLKAATYSVGRDLTNSIVLYSKLASRQHSLLLRVTAPETADYLFRIIDGNLQGKCSTNGIKINGQRCFSHDLKHGDSIVFGGDAKAKYYATANLSDLELLKSSQAADLSGFLSNLSDPFQTLVSPNNKSKNFSEAALVRLASFPELIPNPILEVDLAGTITYLNPAAVAQFPDIREAGLQHPVLVGLLSIEVGSRPTVQQEKPKFFVREVEIGSRVLEQSIHYIPESDLIRSYVVDITERKQAEAQLHKRDSLLQGVAEATNHLLTNPDYNTAIANALAILGMAAEVDRVYLYENHPHPITGEVAMSLRFEWTQGSVEPKINQPYWQNYSYSACDLSRWYAALSTGNSLSGLVREFPAVEQAVLDQGGTCSILMVPIQVSNQFWGYIGFDDCSSERRWSKSDESILFAMAASISGAFQRQQTEQRIRYQALHDQLTDLPNRMLFNDRLELALANAYRSGEMLAVMFLDLDRFKTINDTLGHTVGDRLLKCVAERLTGCLREGDTVARWGGDEFTLLLTQISCGEDAVKTAQRILDTLKPAFSLEGHELYISSSIGIALHPDNGRDAEILIKNADAALYFAKDQGRNNYQLYTSITNSQAPELLALEKSLYRALEREEFILYYQPQVNINTWEITGIEALLRWRHPEMGLIAPQTFIPLAEQNGLIIPIGKWVLRTACAQNRAWQEAGLFPLCVAVNLSAKQFQQPQLVEMIQQILAETKLEPCFLELEVTETTAIQNLDFAKEMLHNLQKLGVRISMDDFGTGYSSLNYLKKLSFDSLKIDRSFVQDLLANSKDAEIVTAMITLGRGLNLKVIAEGVETREQLDFLRALQCEEVQGFHYNQPLPAENLTEVLRTHWQKKLS